MDDKIVTTLNWLQDAEDLADDYRDAEYGEEAFVAFKALMAHIEGRPTNARSCLEITEAFSNLKTAAELALGLLWMSNGDSLITRAAFIPSGMPSAVRPT